MESYIISIMIIALTAFVTYAVLSFIDELIFGRSADSDRVSPIWPVDEEDRLNQLREAAIEAAKKMSFKVSPELLAEIEADEKEKATRKP